MIDRNFKLSIKRQCALLGLPRSTVYYQPIEVCEADHTLMRLIDELHLQYPFAGSRMLRDLLIEICFSLLRRMDEGMDDFLFFADEGSSWEVGIDWGKVLPAWSACLLRATGPEEYARRVLGVIDELIGYGRDKHIAAAKRIETPEQRKALNYV
jgi:hypothetical protein